MFASICESTIQYNCAYFFLPGSAPVHLIKLPCAIDLDFFHPHHLDLPPGHSRVPILPTMKEIHSTPLFPNMPPAQDFSKLGIALIVYIVFQARPTFPVRVQLDSGMVHEKIYQYNKSMDSIKINEECSSSALSIH
ncbi:hypothetical protein DSO57_1026512 [Entomophthora muscae]|uniref:Uncharacterized protein n=1 Tax=Entomophthora muscae TaxID=34485 RepID=A0ACC2RT11_9FUNG|nr:hypothetical protein DSO57_1026512 [Entomophthora muscae]